MLQTRPLSVEEICNKLRPVFGKKIDEIYFRYTLADGREEREEIAHMLNALYQKNLSKLLDTGVLLEPPNQEVIDGDYNLATISYAGRKLFPFKLREKDWQRHVCITGMSGSGKTTLAFRIIEELKRHNKAFLIFDWKKSFRPLIASNNRLMTFTVGEEKVANLFKTNINQPPVGVAPKEWISVIADLLTESFLASFGVHKIILETLDEAFKEWGIYEGSDNYPTWNHIKWRLEERVEQTQGREAGWLESALRIATVLTFGEFGKTLNYKGNDSISVEDLLDQQVIMELNSLGNVEKKFFCEFLLTYIYKLKKAKQNDTNKSFDHAIIVDEAHNIFLSKPTNFSNESVTDMIYREMREYGTSLICLDQHISKISDTVKGNSACHIAFQQQLPQDIEEISKIMQLWEKKHFFSSLQVGAAIVKISERYTQPFLVEVPYSETRKINITNEDIKARMQSMILNHEFKNETDKEFNEAIKNPAPQEKIEKNETSNFQIMSQPEYISNKPVPNKISSLKSESYNSADYNSQDNIATEQDNIHDILYSFIEEHLEKGVELSEVENILEKSKEQGRYTSQDIIEVINKFFDNQLNTKVKKVLSPYNDNMISGLNPEQQVFIEFLQNNPDHTLSTVEVYQKVGLSARKGTNVKKELEEMGLIKIEEEKYNKGWKKLIRLSNHTQR
ncbi:MAG: DUF87 domain-containing protein [archaeon]